MANGVDIPSFAQQTGFLTTPQFAERFQQQFGRQVTQPELQQFVAARGRRPAPTQQPRPVAPTQPRPAAGVDVRIPAQPRQARLTVRSRELRQRPTVPQPTQQPGGIGGAPQTFGQLQAFLNPTLQEERRQQIRQDVARQFAPEIERRRRVGQLREDLFTAQRAQARDVGFGASGLAREGTVAEAEATARSVAEAEAAREAEVRQRIAEAEGRLRGERRDIFGLTQQLGQQQFERGLALSREARAQQQARQQTEQIQARRAQSAIEMASQLDEAGLRSIGFESFGDIESQLGLPRGFVQGLQDTKNRAAQAQSFEQQREAFNDATLKALTLPEGQSFTIAMPDGTLAEFTGSKQNIQIVSNKHGIFSVNKNSGEVSQIQDFAGLGGFAGGGGGRGGAAAAPTAEEAAGGPAATAGSELFQRLAATGTGPRRTDTPLGLRSQADRAFTFPFRRGAPPVPEGQPAGDVDIDSLVNDIIAGL